MTHKNLTAAIRLAAIVGMGIATTVLANDVTKLPPPSTQKDVTFAKDIQPIFKANCVDCHGATRPKNGIRLDSLEGVLKGNKDGDAVIVPGKSDKSDLVFAICWESGPDKKMPPPPPTRRGAPSGGTNNPPPPGPGGPGGPGMGGPRVRKELTPAQIGLVRAWIDQGAK